MLGMGWYRARLDGMVAGKLVTVNEAIPLSEAELAELPPGTVTPMPREEWPDPHREH